MFYPFKRGNWTTFVGLFCVLSFVLMIGAQGALACGKTGCTKTCKLKSSGHNCPMLLKASSESGRDEEKSHTGKVLSLEAFSKIEQNTCPMHPEVRLEKSGKCPECGMKLVKGDFYEVYTCAHKECQKPCVFPKAGKCCGKDLQKTLMSKEEYYDLAQLRDEYFCPMHSEVLSEKAGKCPKCGMNLENRVAQKTDTESQAMICYVCPMHSDEVFPKPGNCSKCGMKLKEKKTTSQ